MHRLIKASGGSYCPPSELFLKIQGLCERYEKNLGSKDSVASEQPISNFIDRRAVKRNSLNMRAMPSNELDSDDPCIALNTRGVLEFDPAFHFTRKGFLNNITFTSMDDTRQVIVITVQRCRKKLKVARHIASMTVREFKQAVGALPNDPDDFAAVNRLCLVFSSSPDWLPLRQELLTNDAGEL